MIHGHGRYGYLILDSNRQADSDSDVILIADSPPEEINDEKSNNGIVVNETVISPTHSVNLSDDDKCSMIEISDESNHSIPTDAKSKFSSKTK